MEMNEANPHRVFAYCHDSVGIGHLSRTLAISERITQNFPASTFLIVTGTPYAALFDQQPRVDYIKLPALAKGEDRKYCGKYLNVSPEEVVTCREALIKSTVEHFHPDTILIDKAPLGVCRELVESIRWARLHRPNTRIIFGMRDIEDSPEATIAQWGRAEVSTMLEECFDEVWVYGMEDLFDVVKEYKLSSTVAAKTRYMGYVSRKVCNHRPKAEKQDPTVLVTVGGGTDGEFVLRCYLSEAAKRVRALGGRSVIVGGPDLPKSVGRALKEQASTVDGVTWIDFEPCVGCRIRESSLVVTMGGYNTLCTIAQHQKRAIVVPRIYPRMEQAIRARLWEKRGAVSVVDPTTMSPSSVLADRVCEMLAEGDAPTNPRLNLQGLDQVTARFAHFLGEGVSRATAVRV